PDSAEAGSSIPLTILGSSFLPNATAEIGGIPLQNIQVVDLFTITGDSPSTLPVGVYNVRVTNPDGQFDQLISVFTVSAGFGDPDGDGSVSAFDASLALQHVVGLITLGSGAQLAADVDGDTFISAFDASLILQFVVGLRSCFPAEPGCTGLARLESASGSLGFAKPVVQRERVTLPVKLGDDVRNVTAVYLRFSFDPSLVSVDEISFNLPEGWLSAHGVKDGHLRVAMAGSTLLPAGTLGTIQLKLDNPTVALSLTGSGSLNSNPPQDLGIVTIGQMPAEYALYQNFPNPFNPSTTVVFDLPKDSRVSLKLYNLLGQEVMTLVSEEQKGGTHRVEVDLSSLGSNIYFYRLVAGTFNSTKKMVLLK
ncbi:MAG TPA: T9SS type A sorting domain-containing protein, partial [Bacteroidota bacterium]